LEMCPTSNAQTHAVPSYAQHPLKRYLDSGVRVTINTDSRLICGVTLTDEYARAVNELGITVADLCRCVLNACEDSFLPLAERAQLITSVRAAGCGGDNAAHRRRHAVARDHTRIGTRRARRRCAQPREHPLRRDTRAAR